MPLQQKATRVGCPAQCGPGGEPECTDPRCSGTRCERWRAQDEKRAYEPPALPEPGTVIGKAADEPPPAGVGDQFARMSDILAAVEAIGEPIREALAKRDEQITTLRSQVQVLEARVAELTTKGASSERRISRGAEHLQNLEARTRRIETKGRE